MKVKTRRKPSYDEAFCLSLAYVLVLQGVKELCELKNVANEAKFYNYTTNRSFRGRSTHVKRRLREESFSMAAMLSSA